MGRKEKIDRYMNFDNILKNGNVCYWSKSIGKSVMGIYDGIEFEVIILNYYKKVITLLYNNNQFTMDITSFKNCNMGKMLGEITNEFKINIGDIMKTNNQDLIITDRKIVESHSEDGRKKHNEKLYKYKCNKCGFDSGEHYRNQEFKKEFWASESNLLGGKGCPCCCNPSQLVVPHINSIASNEETHWMIPYFQGGYDEAKTYNKRSNKRIVPICPDCQRIKDKSISIDVIYSNKSIGCLCGDGKSYPEKLMFNILNQLNLEFETEYSPEWIKPKRYDFALHTIDTLIEVDGDFHRKDNNISGQTKEESEFIDGQKDRLAIENGYKIIRVSDEDNFRQNILSSELSNLFDLSKINWIKAETFALSNRVKEACELKRLNPEMTTTEIGKIMKVSRNTVRKYLKKGHDLEWCYYSVKEEVLTSNKNKSQMNKMTKSKPIEVFKENISIGIYPSATYISENAINILKTDISVASISMVANNKMKQSKGFTFEHVSSC